MPLSFSSVAGDRLDDDAQRAARSYGAAADHFAGPALGFWDRYGEQTVAQLSLAPGGSVLDHVMPGTGYRGTIDALATDEREVVRRTVLAGVRERAITRLRTDVVFGTATRPLTKEA